MGLFMANDTQFCISRRRLTQGAVWTVPVVAVASAAPAYASSSHTPDVTVTSSVACKPQTQGDQSKDYYLTSCFTNDDVHAVTITAPDTALLDEAYTVPIVSATPNPLTLRPGETGCIELHITNSDARDGNIDVVYTAVDTVTMETLSLPVEVLKGDINPCDTGSTP